MNISSGSIYVWATGVMIMGLGAYFYYVRELMAFMILFSMVFLSVSLVVLSVFFAWCAGEQVAGWSRPVSRNAITLLRLRWVHLTER